MKFNYLVVGAGLFGSVFAHEAKEHGKSVLVVDKRPNIAGNIYTEKMEGINVHKYGAHIFHTNDKSVWNYITKFAVLIGLLILQWLIIKENYILCHSTCILLIKCGGL